MKNSMLINRKLKYNKGILSFAERTRVNKYNRERAIILLYYSTVDKNNVSTIVDKRPWGTDVMQ